MILRLLLMFGMGLFTWLLTFGRSIAFHRRQLGWLSGIIFMDELAAISIGMFLARHGSIYDAIATALGGTIAAVIIMKGKKWLPQQQ